MISENFKIPNQLVNKIANNAPSHTSSENGYRRLGQFEDYNEEASGYKTICIFVQNGLFEETNVFIEISKAIFMFQRGNAREYQVFIFGFGQTPTLQHQKQFFTFGKYVGDSSNYKKVAEIISKVSGQTDVNPAIIPEFFPKSDFTTLYGYNKTKIDREDLLIIIGRKDQVSLHSDLEQQMTNKIYKQTLYVELQDDAIQYNYRYDNFNYLNQI